MRRSASAGSRVAAFLCVALLLSCFAGIGVFAAEGVNEISSARIAKNKNTVELSVAFSEDFLSEFSGRTAYLFELFSYQRLTDIGKLAPTAQGKVKSGLSFSLPLNNAAKTRLYSGFFIAVKNVDGAYEPITAVRYIENPQILASADARVNVVGKKGLDIDLFSDAQALGVSHTMIDADLAHYITAAGANTYTYVHDGGSYYFDKGAVELLDHQVKIYSEAGIRVYLNLRLGKTGTVNTPLDALYFAPGDADYHAINTKSADAMAIYTAFVTFLSDRYSGGEHGTAADFVVGYEMNDGMNTNLSGATVLDEYAADGAALLRAAHTAALSKNAGVRVYVSLGNNFGTTSGNESGATDYASRDYLSALTDAVVSGGNFDFGISVNAYPGDRALCEVWNDPAAYDDITTPYITMENIEVLTALLKDDKYLVGGKTRDVIVGEFSVSGDAPKSQALSYAYAYYKAAANDGISALIYTEHTGGTKGLLTDEGEKRQIYSVFECIDRLPPSDIGVSASDIGAQSWSALIKGLDAKTAVKRAKTTGDILEKNEFAKLHLDKKTIFDFTKGNLCGFYPSDACLYTELRGDETNPVLLYAEMSAGGGDTRRGISASTAVEMKNIKVIEATVKAVAPEGTASVPLTLRLRGDGALSYEYEGTANVAAGEWQTVYFELSGFAAESCTQIKLLLDTEGGEGYGLFVKEIAEGHRTVSFFAVVGVVLLVIVGLVALYFAAIFIIKRVRSAKRSGAERMPQASFIGRVIGKFKREKESGEGLSWAYPNRRGITGEIPRQRDGEEELYREPQPPVKRKKPLIGIKKKPQPRPVQKQQARPAQKRQPMNTARPPVKKAPVQSRPIKKAPPAKAQKKPKKRDIFDIEE